jgi:hypothetical protein
VAYLHVPGNWAFLSVEAGQAPGEDNSCPVHKEEKAMLQVNLDTEQDARKIRIFFFVVMIALSGLAYQNSREGAESFSPAESVYSPPVTDQSSDQSSGQILVDSSLSLE